MRRFFFIMSGLVIGIGMSIPALAQMLVGTVQEPSVQTIGGSVTLARSTVEYEYEDDDSVDVDRTMLGLGVHYRLSPRLNLEGQIVYTLDSELEDDGASVDGDGFMLGIGLNYMLHQVDKVKIFGYGFFNMVWDRFDEDNFEADQNIQDLHLGSSAMVALTDQVSLYGGLDFVFNSTGEIEIENGADWEAERDGMVSLFGGLIFHVESVAIRPQVNLGAEQAFSVSLYKVI